jgi:N-acyl-D-amino-acid deacylase
MNEFKKYVTDKRRYPKGGDKIMYDVKIVNGLIIDGTGNPGYAADVGIVGDQIIAIGDLADATSRQTIDASGKVVAPGFVDMHTHSDLAVLFDPLTNSKIFDGVTTEVVGNCGIGVAPVSEANRQLLIDYLGTRMIGNLPVTIELKWESMAEYLDYVRQHPPALNVCALLAQGAVRIAVMGFDKETPTSEQLAEMKALVAASMAEGAVGFSSGLIYMPGEFSTTDELAELAKEIGPYQGFYVSHIRNESEGVFDALEEALTIGGKAGVPVHVSHLKVAGQSVWGRSQELLARIDKANQDGVETTFDLYPYTSGMTGLTACMPPWAFEGGVEKLLTRLADAEIRAKIVADVETGIPGWQNLFKAAGGWGNITITTVNSQANKHLEGKTIRQIADLQDKNPYDTVFDLLLAEKGKVLIVLLLMAEEDLINILRHPMSMIGSDGMSVSTEGIMSFGMPHPRAFGTRARVLARYVREKKVLSLEEAVKKMSYMPAWRLGLPKRGLLRVGYFADAVVFDPDEVKDHAVYSDPKQYSSGFNYVVVNGKVVLANGVHQRVFNGRVLTRNN